MERGHGRLKRAELASGVGAGVLGMGLGILLSEKLRHYIIPVLAIGILLHGWGMFAKHNLEKDSEAPDVWWSVILYWVCWGALFLLAFLINFR
jgi:hypothetical protein